VEIGTDNLDKTVLINGKTAVGWFFSLVYPSYPPNNHAKFPLVIHISYKLSTDLRVLSTVLLKASVIVTTQAALLPNLPPPNSLAD
jgi:hypothetical protein